MSFEVAHVPKGLAPDGASEKPLEINAISNSKRHAW